MAKEILVLTGSPRKNGNTAVLADAFCEGAREAGHLVHRIHVGDGSVHPCLACGYCHAHNGVCCQNDGMRDVDRLLTTADTVVLVSPVYYAGFSAQLKAVVDRLFARLKTGFAGKECVLLTASADDLGGSGVQCLVSHYREIASYLNWTDRGVVYAPHVWEPGQVKGTAPEDKARALGRSL